MTARPIPWLENIKLILSRPKAVQFAALCYRPGADGAPEVLLVTSSRGRWIAPKGWPITGLEGWQIAQQEAWEEAGVQESTAWRDPLTSYDCIKLHGSGLERNCTIWVYPIEVTRMCDDFPEVDRRERVWLPISEAIQRAGEPGLREALQQFAEKMTARA
ncbi:MAG: NUDIX hydrolase [Antarcticimicrobium sp.]|uniref:NUDIX hydrolase n=1 Tax=Antarcticimicrobium sp. TaxID=2824147 RepID=UPI002634FEDC|nr:NUDIX hydrolase [Antarcticimicrobium sp.]MDF1717228.1 NUDIX hydrolase [Antarcticimicrobium sp.]